MRKGYILAEGDTKDFTFEQIFQSSLCSCKQRVNWKNEEDKIRISWSPDGTETLIGYMSRGSKSFRLIS